MFRFAISMAVALAVIGSFTSRAAQAQEAKCEGTISKVEGEKVTVRTTTNEEHQLTVVPSTKVMLDGKAAKPSDLKPGLKVKCTANKEGDKLTCNMIEATTRPN